MEYFDQFSIPTNANTSIRISRGVVHVDAVSRASRSRVLHNFDPTRPSPKHFNLTLKAPPTTTTMVAKAESSKAVAQNGIKANPNTVGSNYELPWLA
jgi:hypothetical protein